MSLVANWRRVLRHAWSVRFNVLLAFAAGADAANGYFADGRLGPAALVFAVSALATGARFVAQDKVSGA